MTDYEISLPHLMDTIQSYSKLSGYTINWNKSAAMPMAPVCHAHMVEKFKFRWIPKDMKYLGIQLSQDLEDLLNMNLNVPYKEFKQI